MASTVERRWFAGIILAVIVLDRVTKLIAEARLPRYLGVPVLGDVLNLQLVYNRGAAFGIHVGDYSRWVFMALTVVALVVLASMARHTKTGDGLRLYAIAAVMAGAAGNLIDRVRSSRGVVDFLDVTIGPLHWPTFNVADMAISCGAVALALALWSEGRVTHAVPTPEVAPLDQG
jgi:signal peptidase II